MYESSRIVIAELNIEFDNCLIHCICTRKYLRNRKTKPKEFHETYIEELNLQTECCAQLTSETKLPPFDEEAVSCYCSASHTDNNCSTDDGLHLSDSGADLSETGPEKEIEWEKYWEENGYRLVWESWIEKYREFINPEYLENTSSAPLNGNLVNASSSNQEEILEIKIDNSNDGLSLSPESSTSGSSDSMTNVTSLSCSGESIVWTDGSTSSSSLDIYWQELWNQHFKEQYYFHYNVFHGKTTLLDSTEKNNEDNNSAIQVENQEIDLINNINLDETDKDINTSSETKININETTSSDESENQVTALIDTEKNKLLEQIKEMIERQELKDEEDVLESPKDNSKEEMDLEITTIINKPKKSREKKKSKKSRKIMDSVGEFLSTLTDEDLNMPTIKNTSSLEFRRDLSDMGFNLSENLTGATEAQITYRKKHSLNPLRRKFSQGEKVQLLFSKGDDLSSEDETQNEEKSDGNFNPFSENNKEGLKTQSEESDTSELPSKKRKKNELGIELEELKKLNLAKYWKQRFQLFSKWKKGIALDAESWYSVTPEIMAKHIARRCQCDLIVDAMCGAGGNSIQFAFTCERVIAIDIDPAKIALARHNASIYNVEDRIEFIVGDFFQLAPTLTADVVFLSPPWGGPDYQQKEEVDIDELMNGRGSELFETAQTITKNIAYYVPKNIKADQMMNLARNSGYVEIEQNLIGERLKGITAYYGELIV